MLGFGIDANGSNMRCEKKGRDPGRLRVWGPEQLDGVTAKMRNNGRPVGLENK